MKTVARRFYFSAQLCDGTRATQAFQALQKLDSHPSIVTLLAFHRHFYRGLPILDRSVTQSAIDTCPQVHHRLRRWALLTIAEYVLLRRPH
jgi:hypothetical protein